MKSMRKGFTLIELMIVVAIIAIIAAIAIPNLLRSRIQANEANAIAALKAYASAQVIFQSARNGRLAANTTTGERGFADNFRNLQYGNPVIVTGGALAADAQNLALISQAFADAIMIAAPAAAGLVGGAAVTVGTGATAAVGPYQGYRFGEDPSMRAAAAVFNADFAMVAYPERNGSTGLNGYYVGQEGSVHMTPLPASTASVDWSALDGVFTTGNTPHGAAGVVGQWRVM